MSYSFFSSKRMIELIGSLMGLEPDEYSITNLQLPFEKGIIPVVFIKDRREKDREDEK